VLRRLGLTALAAGAIAVARDWVIRRNDTTSDLRSDDDRTPDDIA
jgi:hypothetical protein